MFWGLIMEPHRRYTQVVKIPFHISMAALDIETSGEEPAQVICGYEGKHYLLCTLQKGHAIQCALDLEFAEGKEVSFASNGVAHIHLTGYLTSDEMFMDDEDDSIMVEEEEGTSKKRSKSTNGLPSKKLKSELLDSASDSDEEDSRLYLDDIGEEEEEDDEEEEFEDSEDSEDSEDIEESKNIKEVEKLPKNKTKSKGLPTKVEKEQKQKSTEKAKINGPPSKLEKNKSPRTQTIQGVTVQDLKVGNGKVAKAGNFLTVYYEGRLKQNNKVFDSSKKGSGFKFRLGEREVIKGWAFGLEGMKVGGKRRITCPPHMAYGAKGSPPIVPPNSTLIFDVELKSAQ